MDKELFPKSVIINYCKLPEHIREGMRLYVERGCPVGAFLEYVITNNLVMSLGKADQINRARIFDICDFMYNEAPAPCWGSIKKYKMWIEKGGLKGE